MTAYDIYILCLCIVVFIGFVALFGWFLAALTKSYLKMLRAGLEDEEIKTEYNLAKKKKASSRLFGRILLYVIGLAFIAVFVFSAYVNIQEDAVFDSIPSMKVVRSGSMSKKQKDNLYLFTNDLNDQIQTFDLIFIYKKPAQTDLKQYDIVLYEVDGAFVVHRIIEIEEPNEKHPEARYFLCRGDANVSSDRFPVLYEQIKGVYRGGRIPFIGSFIDFMQSPAGYLCVFLMLFAVLGLPVLERKLEKEKRLRLLAIGYINEAGDIIPLPPENKPTEEQTPPPTPATTDEDKEEDDKTDAASRIRLSFLEKLAMTDAENRNYFYTLDRALRTYRRVRASVSQRGMTYIYGRIPVAKITLHGKTIKLYLALNVNDFDYNRFFQKDVSDMSTYEKVPFLVKVKSARGQRRALELILALAQKHALNPGEAPMPTGDEWLNAALGDANAEKIADIIGTALPHLPITEVPAEEITVPEEPAPDGASLTEFDTTSEDEAQSRRTFAEKLADISRETQDYYIAISNLFLAYKKVRVNMSRRSVSYFSGRDLLAKINLHGSIMRLYLALDVDAFAATKYFQKSSAHLKAYEKVPFTVKVQSDNGLKRALELITIMCEEKGLKKHSPPTGAPAAVSDKSEKELKV